MKGILAFFGCLLFVFIAVGQHVVSDLSETLHQDLPHSDPEYPYHFSFTILPPSQQFKPDISAQTLHTFLRESAPSFTVSYTKYPTYASEGPISRGQPVEATMNSAIPEYQIPYHPENLSSYIEIEEHQASNVLYQHFIFNDVLFFSFSFASDSLNNSQELQQYIRETSEKYAHIRWTIFMISCNHWSKKHEQYFDFLDQSHPTSYTSLIYTESEPSQKSYIQHNHPFYFIHSAYKKQSIPFVFFSEQGLVYSELSLSNFSPDWIQDPSCLHLTAQLTDIQNMSTLVLLDKDPNRNLAYLEINLNNSTNHPINFQGELSTEDDIFPSVGEIETIIYPGAQKKIRTQIKTLSHPDSLDNLWLDWNWNASIDFTHRQDVNVSGHLPIPLIPSTTDIIPHDRISFIDDTTIRLNHLDPEMEIRYTWDGKNPDQSSTRYSDSIHIDQDGILKLIMVYPYGGQSKIDSCLFNKVKPAQGLWYEYIPYNPGLDVEEVLHTISRYPALLRDTTHTWQVNLSGYRLHHFALRYNGRLRIEKGGKYQFDLLTDQYAILSINGSMIYSSDEVSQSLELDAGLYNFELVYLHETGPLGWNCHVKGPGLSQDMLPIEWLTFD